MLPKRNRANKKAVEIIFKEGKFVNSNNLTLKFILNSHSEGVCVSFITPKSASKKAVIRNLLRRRGYSILKNYMNRFPSGFLGAFVFGKKSTEFFSGKKKKDFNPISNLDKEISLILSKVKF